MREGYSVTVSKYGEKILTIERHCISGESDLSDDDLRGIKDAAEHLAGFAGDPDKPTACFMCRGVDRCEAGCPASSLISPPKEE